MKPTPIFKKESMARKAEILRLSTSTLKRLKARGINTDDPLMVECAVVNSRVLPPQWQRGNPNRWPYRSEPIEEIKKKAMTLCTCDGKVPLCYSCHIHISFRNYPPLTYPEFAAIRDSVELS